MSARALIVLSLAAAGAAALLAARRAQASVAGGAELGADPWGGGYLIDAGDGGNFYESGMGEIAPPADTGVHDQYSGSYVDEHGNVPPFIGGPDVGLSALTGAAQSFLDWVSQTAGELVGVSVPSVRWLTDAGKPENYAYVAALNQAEAANGVPQNLCVRQCWQESRFNPNAYNVASGATGIMQIIPRFHPTVNAWEPFSSIAYGVGYLAQNFRRFGTWELALKAYNWGPTSVANWLKGQGSEPAETKNYSRQILADVRATGVAIV